MTTTCDKHWDFFLAHASADKAFAEQLYEMLDKLSRAFIGSRCLKLGDDWDLELAKAQRASKVSVILVSSNATQAYYQREEIAAAIELARTDDEHHRVVPLYLPNTDRHSPTIPYGLRLKHGLTIESKNKLPTAATKLLDLLKQITDDESIDDVSERESTQQQLNALLSKFSENCTKAKALEVENMIYELVKDDEELLLANARQYVAPAREAIAVVAGRMLHSGYKGQQLIALLTKLTKDPDMWVRRKAKDGLILSGYSQEI